MFALSNPDPEIHPDVAAKYAAVVATGRSDFPNQINNVLAFPGVFRGALDAGARRITEKMKVAAAEAIFSVVGDDLAPDRIVPSPLDPRVGPAVAQPWPRRCRQPRSENRPARGAAARRRARWFWPAARPAPATTAAVAVVGGRIAHDAESMLLAGIYAAALRSYGFAAQVETADDPMARLDSGAVTVVPALHRPGCCRPCSPARRRCPTRRSTGRWSSALPEGVAAGDYTTAAEDKPVAAGDAIHRQGLGRPGPQRGSEHAAQSTATG